MNLLRTFLQSVPVIFLFMLISGCGTGAGNPAIGSGGGGGSSSGTLFSDDFEQGSANWIADAYWYLDTDAYSGDSCLHVWDSDDLTGAAQIQESFDLSDYDSAVLTFWSRTTYGNMGSNSAVCMVLVEVNDDYTFQPWQALFQYNQDWTQISVYLLPYCGWGSKVEIAFWYQKYDYGTIRWWIDDVQITAE